MASRPLPALRADAEASAVIVTVGPQGELNRMMLTRTGKLVSTGRYRFSDGVGPIQALDGRLLLQVLHYPRASSCPPTDFCAAPRSTISLVVADARGQLLWAVPSSLGVACGASLVPGQDAVLALMPTSDSAHHMLMHLRLLPRVGQPRELTHFIPHGTDCAGSIAVTPDGAQAFVTTYAGGAPLERVDLASAQTTPISIRNITPDDVQIAISPDGRRLALAIQRTVAIVHSFAQQTWTLALAGLDGSGYQALPATSMQLNDPTWVTPTLLIAEQNEPRFALELLDLENHTAITIGGGADLRILGAFS